MESELVLLYRTRGKHKDALDLLTVQMRGGPGGGTGGIQALTEYLQRLGPDDIDYVLKVHDWHQRKKDLEEEAMPNHPAVLC